MFTKERISNILYALLSLLFALILFFNPNSASISKTILSPNTLEETVQVPIQPIYDTEQYFIQGYEPTATVRLSSLNRILLNGEVNEETRTFRVVTDLTNLGEGTHTVPLKVQNLTTGVTATLEPASIIVTIEKLETKSFPVEVNISDENLAKGYQLAGLGVNPEQIEVTTGNLSMQEITKVVANLDNLEGIDKNLAKEVPVYAVNKEGEIMNAILSSEKVTVTVEIKAPQKEVPLYLEQVGELPADISHFELSLSQSTAVIIGSPELLEKYDHLTLTVDVSKVKKQTQQTISLEVEKGMFVHPQQVMVTITPVFIKVEDSKESKTSTPPAPSSEKEEGVSTTESSETSARQEEKTVGMAGEEALVDETQPSAQAEN
ncbi:CdaR family protein [Enterococcus sp. LJL98]